jgi:hypothetical protein
MKYSDIKINLGCGLAFIDSPEWINLDYSPSAPTVRKANLLGRLPLEDASASLVYSSHFLEHVPRSMVSGLLRECIRVLKPGGYVRFVLPDLENMVREYNQMRERGEHEKADFVVLEMIDQCVRPTSGGELGRLYSKLKQAPEVQLDLINFIGERTGENLHTGSSAVHMSYRGGGYYSPHAACPWSCGEGLVASRTSVASSGFSYAECQSRRSRRAAPLAVGFPSIAAGTRSCRVHRSATPFSRQLCDSRFPILSARHRTRWANAQGCRVDVCGSGKGGLIKIAVAFSQGGRND